MLDRVPTKPGRVLISPENGSAAFYATMARADEPTQEGNPLNKNTLLTDNTASMFGLGSNSVPNDVFAFLGKFNLHWWSVYHDLSTEWYEEIQTKITSSVTLSGTISYATEIVLSKDNVSLVSPQTVTLSGSASSSVKKANLQKLVGKYFIVNSTVYYLPATAVVGTSGASYPIYYDPDSNSMAGRLTALNQEETARIVTSKSHVVAAGETTYEHSSDRNAYPDSGKVDGLTYDYLGVPFSDFVAAPKLIRGSYVGTGAYGESNPNSLTFDFVPKIVIVCIKKATAPSGLSDGMVYIGQPGDTTYSSVMSLNDKTLSWYNKNSAANQLNASGTTYYYIALG